jgi:NADH:ubiquinone oxidoreductase subunit D
MRLIVRPGGVAQDLPKRSYRWIFIYFVINLVKVLDDIWNFINWAIEYGSIRTVGIRNCINLSMLLTMGLLGLCLRASGVSFWYTKTPTLLMHMMYLINDKWYSFLFTCWVYMVIVYDRYCVRVEEMRSSVNLICSMFKYDYNLELWKIDNGKNIFRFKKFKWKIKCKSLIEHFKLNNRRVYILPKDVYITSIESTKRGAWEFS